MKSAPEDPLQADDIWLRERTAHLLEERFTLFSFSTEKRVQREGKKSCIYCDLGKTELNNFDQYFDFSDKSSNQHWHKQLVSKPGGGKRGKSNQSFKTLIFPSQQLPPMTVIYMANRQYYVYKIILGKEGSKQFLQIQQRSWHWIRCWVSFPPFYLLCVFCQDALLWNIT